MKKFFFSLLTAVIALSACNKESETPLSQNPGIQKVHKTFEASSVVTKTYLDGMDVKWSQDDKINVIAESGEQYTFTIVSGANTASAVFEGDVNVADAEGAFYAVYPDVNVSLTKDDKGVDIIEFLGSAFESHERYFDKETVKAVKDGFDGRYAPMTAVMDENGKFEFRHGAAFFKIKIGVEDVKTIKLECGDARFNGRPKYNISDGSTNQVESAKAFIYAEPEVGVFEKDATYFIPVLTKQSNVKNLTVTYTGQDGISASMTTDKLYYVKLASGFVYDLGCPPITFAPKINVTAPAALAADATSGSFAYSLVRPDGESSVTAKVTSGNDWLSNVVVEEEIVSFDCTANVAEEAREAVIVLSYPGAEDVEVTITQNAVAGSDPGTEPGEEVANTYTLYVDSSKTIVNTGEYFTTVTKNIAYFSPASDDVNYNGPFTIDGTEYEYGLKMDGSGQVVFTTSKSYNTTVQFYFACRKSADASASRMKITSAGGEEKTFECPYETYGDSGVLTLEKDTEYTIARGNKENGLILVIVKETE